MSYKFLTKVDDFDGRTSYFAIPDGKIETLRVSQTYDQFGQTVGTYNVGDSIELLSERAVVLANTVAKEQDEDYNFSKDDIVSGYDNSDVFDEIEEAFNKAGLKVDEDYSLYAETCEGFDYWDGHNNRTLVVSYESDGTPSHELLNDEELEEKLNNVIENMQFDHEAPGCKIYRSGEWIITESFWQGAWESYEINLFEEED